jgi:hypothetical protein
MPINYDVWVREMHSRSRAPAAQQERALEAEVAAAEEQLQRCEDPAPVEKELNEQRARVASLQSKVELARRQLLDRIDAILTEARTWLQVGESSLYLEMLEKAEQFLKCNLRDQSPAMLTRMLSDNAAARECRQHLAQQVLLIHHKLSVCEQQRQEKQLLLIRKAEYEKRIAEATSALSHEGHDIPEGVLKSLSELAQSGDGSNFCIYLKERITDAHLEQSWRLSADVFHELGLRCPEAGA